MRAVQAYAQPVYNGDTLLPVESGFERDVSHLLFWLQESLFEGVPELRIKITKPLFASKHRLDLAGQISSWRRAIRTTDPRR